MRRSDNYRKRRLNFTWWNTEDIMENCKQCWSERRVRNKVSNFSWGNLWNHRNSWKILDWFGNCGFDWHLKRRCGITLLHNIYISKQSFGFYKFYSIDWSKIRWLFDKSETWSSLDVWNMGIHCHRQQHRFAVNFQFFLKISINSLRKRAFEIK